MLKGDFKCICNVLQGLGEMASSVQNVVVGMIHLA